MNEALGWTLFHFLWEGAAVALLLAVVLALTGSSRVRYAAACAALLAMLAAFGITLAVKLPADLSNGGRVHVPAGLVSPRPPALDAAPVSAPGMPLYRWAVPLWLAGVMALSLHRLAGLAGAWRLRRTGIVPAPAPWPERMTRLAARLGLGRRVVLLESCLTDVPVVVGWLRPAILLPLGLAAGLPAEQVEFILIHELAHIARRDYLMNLLQNMVEALLFYHPAVWWVSAVMRAEREHCCDDIVVALAGDAPGYAAVLVKLEQRRAPEPMLAATGGSLTRRVRRLLRQPSSAPSAAAPLAAVALAMAIAGLALASQTQTVQPPAVILPHPKAPELTLPVLVFPQSPALKLTLPVVTMPLLAQTQVERQRQLKQEMETPYRKWLNQDVAYIITDQERSAFKALQTDNEREKFIEQFWLRRDPTPGTVENEFKEEHYRRIAFANEHFSAGIPGWKTDRGRIYITYGPPDEIEDHTSGGTLQRPAAQGGGAVTAFPFQDWRYKYIEGIGNNVIIEFVDPTRTGEYHMTMDPAEKNVAPLVFGANEIGGRSTVSVSGRRVLVNLPLSPAGDYQISGQILTAGGQVVQNFQDPLSLSGNAGVYRKAMPLSAGSYRLVISYKNTTTGEARSETVNFNVN